MGEPVNVALDIDDSIFVASSTTPGGIGRFGIIRVDPETGAQTLVSSQSAIDVDLAFSGYLLFSSLQNSPNEIVKLNRSTGVQMVVSQGGELILPLSLAVFRVVLIDIKPGNDRNNINICAEGVLRVAIFSSETFDATEVDPTTVDLEGAGVKLDKKDNLVVKIQDVNDDGLSDMVAKFEIPELVDLTSEDTEAELTGSTFDGIAFTSMDAVEVKQQMCVRTLE